METIRYAVDKAIGIVVGCLWAAAVAAALLAAIIVWGTVGNFLMGALGL